MVPGGHQVPGARPDEGLQARTGLLAEVGLGEVAGTFNAFSGVWPKAEQNFRSEGRQYIHRLHCRKR